MPCLAIPLVIEAHTHEHSFDERAHHLLFACVDVCILELTDTEIRIHGGGGGARGGGGGGGGGAGGGGGRLCNLPCPLVALLALSHMPPWAAASPSYSRLSCVN